MNRDRQKTYDLEALEELILDLQEASSSGALIIVEGVRDRASLRHLGVNGDIITASQRSPMELAEEAARCFPEIVLLTDWDQRGEELAQMIEEHLRHTPSHVDLDIRRRLKIMVRKEIKDVEGLSSYIEKVRELYGT